jgi:hypothetical protein
MIDIIRKNNCTFYNYDTGKWTPIRYRLLLFVLLSMILTVVLKNPTESLLTSILTIQSILVGFSFNVLFFLTTNADSKPEYHEIEFDILHGKLSKLKIELFYNISYFIMVSIVCILASLLIIVPSIDVSVTRPIGDYVGDEFCRIFSHISSIFWYVLYFILYFSTIEGIYTFSRTTYRIVFLFGKKMSQETVR